MRFTFLFSIGVWMMGTMAWADPMSPPEVLRVGHEDYPSLDSRRIQMVSSLVVADNGRIWITWYAGPTPGEDDNNYIVLATSEDDGETWREVLVVNPDGSGPVRAFDPEIWLDPQGRMWLLWAQAVRHGHEAHTWAMVTENPKDSDPEWIEPFHVAPGVMMCKPTILSDGEWLFPVSDWAARLSKAPDGVSAGTWISTDQGKSFTLRGSALVPANVRTFDEHMVVERKDGSLWKLIRTNYGIGESVSTDRGRTWTEVSPSNIPHPAARFFIRRLDSGNLLLVKHGSMEAHTGRSHLTAFISKDDGATWQGGLMLDIRGGISYPDGQQTTDGAIYITYDYMRTRDRAIFMCAFTEADVLAGEDVSGKVRLRIAVSNPGMILVDPTLPYASDAFKLADNADGVEPNFSTIARLEPMDEDEVDTLDLGALIWFDRIFVFSVLPEELIGKQFIRGTIDASRFRVKQDGYVYVIVRRSSSSERKMLENGFEKTNIPEFIPFALRDSYRDMYGSSVYQKFVKAGDVIDRGPWGVTVFAAK